MTLIVAIPASDGIVMASDGQITTGLVRAPGKKIYPLSDHAAWAASGELALVQRVAERLEGPARGPAPGAAQGRYRAGYQAVHHRADPAGFSGQLFRPGP